ncbi:hypothetical protein RKD23_003678 [Streptomyces sp. SAI-170]|uniref:hypothetical protein n=1 Tax=Streptomyces sp. SAI-170 TaxID=3377729 RepID=UPI003C7BEC7F
MRATPFSRHEAGRPVLAGLAFATVAAAVVVGRPGLETVVGCGGGNDPWPSQTARNWVTYADHVVVASPTAEEETNRREYRTGAVRYATDRLVTFRTDGVLWSAERPAHAMGRDFRLTAPGWATYRATGNRTELTTGDAPRLEPGHTYLLALRWDAGRWTPLGEGAAVPFDDGVAGRGEWCGRVLPEQDVARGERFSRRDDQSLEETLLGQGEAAVSRELGRAEGR